MKTTIGIFVSLLIACSLYGQVHFETLEWSSALKKASKEKKLVFVDCYTTWCYWCKVMDKQTFPTEKVGIFANAHFVSVRMDMEQEPGLTLGRKYSVMSYPTYLIFNSSGNLLYRIAGFQDSTAFLASLTNATKPDSQLHLSGYSSNLSMQLPEFYTTAIRTHTEPKDSVVSAYFEKQTNLFEEQNWKVLSRFGWRIEKYKQFLLTNREKYRTLFGKDEVDNLLYQMFRPELDSAILKKNRGLLTTYVQKMHTYELSTTKEDDLAYTLSFYQLTFGYDSLIILMEQAASLPSEKARNEMLNNASWGIYTSCTDSGIIHRATVLMQKLAETGDYAGKDTYASLLFKDKQYAHAETAALDAIEAAKKEKINPVSTIRLLTYIHAATKKDVAYKKRSECELAVMVGPYCFVCFPHADTIKHITAKMTIADSTVYSEGLDYQTSLDIRSVSSCASSPIMLFSPVKVRVISSLNGSIALTYHDGSPSYVVHFVDGSFNQAAQKKIKELSTGDTITIQGLYLSDGATVVPTKICLHITN